MSTAPSGRSPRYTTRELPRYRHLPGATPHPERDPAGHMYGEPEPTPPPCQPTRWRDNELYLYGVDLFNQGYWWEAHTVWESLWKATPRDALTRSFLQGLIQIAAGMLKRRAGDPRGERKLLLRGLDRLEKVERRAGSPRFMGIPLNSFAAQVQDALEDPSSADALRIELG